MKQFLTIGIIGTLCSSFTLLPNNYEVILSQFERLAGNWEGVVESTSYEDNATKQTIPARCESVFDGKSWLYTVTYDEGGGHYYEGAGECLVNNDGSMMMYNGIKWIVMSVEESGDTTSIVMETKGKDNRKRAMLRQTLQVTDKTFFIIEEVKYDSGGDYFVRNKHLFRRMK